MKIFGMRIISDDHYSELVEASIRDTRMWECRRWFAQWKDLDIIWDYIAGKEGVSLWPVRDKYSKLRDSK